jgi:tripartite-type tricarboxylate transporter receptor subunit TctC
MSAGAARAQESFPGNKLTIQVGYAPGGGNDIYARMLAHYLPTHLPNRPTIIVENVPGAGSLTLANNMYGTAPRDGSVIATVAQTMPLNQIVGAAGIRFDAAKFNWIGRTSSSVQAMIFSGTLPVRSIEDLRKTEVIVSASGPASGASLFPILLNVVLGTKLKIVRGYSGVPESVLAIERGEAGATSVTLSSLMGQYGAAVKEGKFRILAQNAVDRHPAIQDVPTTVELARNDEEREMLTLFASVSDIGRAYFIPPGVPEARVAELRKAFADTMKDPELVAYAKANDLELDPMKGEDLQKLIQDMSKVPAATIEKAKSVIAEDSKG